MPPALKLPRLPQLKPRERLYATGAAAILLIVILDRLVLSPWFEQVETIQAETRRLEQALQHHGRLLARKGIVDEQMAIYERYLRRPMPPELQTAMLIKELESMAEQSRILRPEIKPLAVETDALSLHYPLDLVFECTLEEWVEFVIRIETSPSMFEVSRAALATNPDAPDKLRGTLRVISTAMRLPADEAIGAVPEGREE
jgi:hypothetical protein